VPGVRRPGAGEGQPHARLDVDRVGEVHAGVEGDECVHAHVEHGAQGVERRRVGTHQAEGARRRLEQLGRLLGAIGREAPGGHGQHWGGRGC